MATRTTGRIKIPQNVTELLALAQKIHEKHMADGDSSALHAMQDRNWSEAGPKLAACVQNHEDAETSAKKAEQFYRQRDVDLPAIREIVRNSASLLKSIYSKNPKVLSEYGLEVDDSRPEKPKSSEK